MLNSWLADLPAVGHPRGFSFDEIIVLDLANNHQGDVKHGLKIIESCARLQESSEFKIAIKFQFRELETFLHKSARESDKPDKYTKRFLDTELPWSDFEKMQNRATDLGLLTACTPFDEPSVSRILNMGFDFLKIASASASDWPLLESAASTRLPIVASTGGIGTEDVDRLVSFITNRGCHYALMHCISMYPAPDNELQLTTIQSFLRRYPGVTVGWSTHERPDNYIAAAMAYAHGARIFERHVGLEAPGVAMNAYSSGAEELKQWISTLEQARLMDGGNNGREVTEAEEAEIDALRRGVFSRSQLNPNDSVTELQFYFAFPALQEQLSPGELKPKVKVLSEVMQDAPVMRNSLEESVSNPGELHSELVRGLHQIKGMLSENLIATPRRFETELSHHYGPESFLRYGTTLITTVDRAYAKKILIQLPGQSNPPHKHLVKEETFYVLSGSLKVVKAGQEFLLGPGDSLGVLPGEVHEFSSDTGCIFEEISSRIEAFDSIYLDEIINEAGEARKTRLTLWGKGSLEN